MDPGRKVMDDDQLANYMGVLEQALKEIKRAQAEAQKREQQEVQTRKQDEEKK